MRFFNVTSAIATARLRKHVQNLRQADSWIRLCCMESKHPKKHQENWTDPTQQRSYVTNSYDRRSSITSLLSELQWPSLQERRRQSRLAMLFRIRFNLVDINWKDHLSESTYTTRGHSCRFINPRCSSQVYNSSFFTRTSREWNTLKIDPSDFQTLNAFKLALRGAST